LEAAVKNRRVTFVLLIIIGMLPFHLSAQDLMNATCGNLQWPGGMPAGLDGLTVSIEYKIPLEEDLVSTSPFNDGFVSTFSGGITGLTLTGSLLANPFITNELFDPLWRQTDTSSGHEIDADVLGLTPLDPFKDDWAVGGVGYFLGDSSGQVLTDSATPIVEIHLVDFDSSQCFVEFRNVVTSEIAVVIGVVTGITPPSGCQLEVDQTFIEFGKAPTGIDPLNLPQIFVIENNLSQFMVLINRGNATCYLNLSITGDPGFYQKAVDIGVRNRERTVEADEISSAIILFLPENVDRRNGLLKITGAQEVFNITLIGTGVTPECFDTIFSDGAESDEKSCDDFSE